MSVETKRAGIDWENIVSLFNTVKWMYALCEETDPQLNTNLQPLNEFRAALDHLMRIIAIQNLNAYQDRNEQEEADKLYSHLRRAFFDIADLLSINYRKKIIDMLEAYDIDCIHRALPDYYSTMRPRLEIITGIIAELRTGKRVQDRNAAVQEYSKIVEELKKYYDQVVAALPSFDEIHIQARVQKRRNVAVQWIIPIAGIVIGAVVGILGFIF